MKQWIRNGIWGLALAGSLAGAGTLTMEQQAQQLAKTFGGQLKSVLQGAMHSGGPVQALNVCKANAPQIASTIASTIGMDKGWKVGRTSLKVRNPSNAPDAWETVVLQQWSQQLAAGTPLAELKAATVMEMNGKPTFRYMQAIPTGELCLTCHGSQLASPVQEALAELYPQDQATGFKQGDLRGAFTLQKVAEE